MLPRNQNTSAHEAISILTPLSGTLPEAPKIIDLRPSPRDAAMLGKHTIYYTLARFMSSRATQISVFRVPGITALGAEAPHYQNTIALGGQNRF